MASEKKWETVRELVWNKPFREICIHKPIMVTGRPYAAYCACGAVAFMRNTIVRKQALPKS